MLSLGEIASFHNYWIFYGDIKYHYRINSLILLNSGFDLELSNIDVPRHRLRKDFMFRLNTGITFNF